MKGNGRRKRPQTNGSVVFRAPEARAHRERGLRAFPTYVLLTVQFDDHRDAVAFHLGAHTDLVTVVILKVELPPRRIFSAHFSVDLTDPAQSSLLGMPAEEELHASRANRQEQLNKVLPLRPSEFEFELKAALWHDGK